MMKAKGIVKKSFAAILAAVLFLTLAGCGTKLPDGFEEETVKETATKFLDYLTVGEYDSGMDMMSEVMKNALSKEDLTAIMEDLDRQAGAFKEYKSIAVVGQTAQGVEYATAVVVASYEKRNVTYTVVFNTDMEIDGFYLR
ncbi:MAG: DUF3887 domain-containing protein [Lachnospiraceae bacterium]|nr:DUF3887 domain-containing protein [Lachnospiraceae bacterium]